MIEGDGYETVYASPPKGPDPTTCSGCHFLEVTPSVMEGATAYSDCRRFPKWVPITDPNSHSCGEWRSKVR